MTPQDHGCSKTRLNCYGMPCCSANLVVSRYSRTVGISITALQPICSVFMLIWLAGLAGISQEVRDAASIDGASPLRRFWHIELPLL